jgi:transcriptional regulator with XRE-family HTH domain
MARGKSNLLDALPFQVEETLRALGANLRTARIRRGLTLEAAAAKINVRRALVADAESGKAATGVAVYLALLWAYDLLEDAALLANPTRDKVGLALANAEQRQRVRREKSLDDDF